MWIGRGDGNLHNDMLFEGFRTWYKWHLVWLMVNLREQADICPYQTVDWSSQNIEQNKCCDMRKYCCCWGVSASAAKRSLAKKSCYDHTLVHSNTSMHISAAHTGWEVLAKGQSLLAFDCFLIICARPNWPLPTVEVWCCCAHHRNSNTHFLKSDISSGISFYCI